MNKEPLWDMEKIRAGLGLALESNMTFDKLSEETGISSAALHSIVHGNVTYSRPHTLRKLQNFLEMQDLTLRQDSGNSSDSVEGTQPDEKTLLTLYDYILSSDSGAPFVPLSPSLRGSFLQRKELHFKKSAKPRIEQAREERLPRTIEDWAHIDNLEEHVLMIRGHAGSGKTMLAWDWFTREFFIKRRENAKSDTNSSQLEIQCIQNGVAASEREELSSPSQSGKETRKRMLEASDVIYWTFTQQYPFASFIDALLMICTGKEHFSSCRALAESKKLELIRSVLIRRPMLLVLDSFDNELLFHEGSGSHSEKSAKIQTPSLPRRQCRSRMASAFLETLADTPMLSKIIIISRVTPSELDRKAGITELVLSDFTDEEALSYFRAEIGLKNPSPADDDFIASICKAVDNHPASLYQLTELINSDPQNMGSKVDPRVINDYGKLDSLLLNLDGGYAKIYHLLPLPVKNLCQWLAVFDPITPSYAMLAAIYPETEQVTLKKCLTSLIDANLLRMTGDSTFHMHRLLKISALADMSIEETKRRGKTTRDILTRMRSFDDIRQIE